MSYTFNKDAHGGPCKGCKERHEKCHAKCEAYGAWKAERKAAADAERADKQRYATLSDVARREMWRSQRYSRNQPRHHSGKSD